MTTEEKAKAYDNVREKIAIRFGSNVAKEIFSEYEESEDEKIRKGLVAHLKDLREWKVGKSVPIKTSGHYDAWLAWIEKHGEQKQEWSEEDLISLGYLATFVDENGDCFYGQNKPNVVKWIRSFANLNPTQKQEWSEEDEKHIRSIISTIECSKAQFPNSPAVVDVYESDLVWLKSLRPQNWTKEDKERYINCLQRLGTGHPEQPETIDSKWFKEHVYPLPIWKPSDEHIYALRSVVTEIKHSDNKYQETIEDLYNDLKKLREE